MPRPSLPKADELAELINAARLQGVELQEVQTQPDGSCTLKLGSPRNSSAGSLCDEWEAKNDST